MAPKHPPRTALTLPRLLLCEGPSDEAFFRALIRHRRLPEFCIRHTGELNSAGSGGIDQFGPLLRGVVAYEGFPNVTDILVAADADETPEQNFAKVRDQIAAARPETVPPVHFSIPSAPLERKGDRPTVTVLMIPWAGVKGNLESLCLSAAQDTAAASARCVDQFADCTGASGWPEVGKLGKMKLRSLLAAKHKRDPFIGLGNVWVQNEDLIPLGHASFDKIADVLAGYGA